MACTQTELGELLEVEVEAKEERAEREQGRRRRAVRVAVAGLAATALLVLAAAALSLHRGAEHAAGLEVVELDAPVGYNSRLVAFRDAGKCGPRADDLNADWCGWGLELQCKPCVSVKEDVCPSRQAYLVKQHGGSAKRESTKELTIGGCEYMYVAVYNCVSERHGVPRDEPPRAVRSVKCSPDEPLLYVGVETSPREFRRRASGRRDWMRLIKRNPTLRSCVKVEFIVGHYPTSWLYANVERKLRKEAKRYQDIRQLPMVDNYVNRPDKTLYLMEEGLRRNARFIVKIDADQRLFVHKTFRLARSLHPTESVYAAATRIHDTDADMLLGSMSNFVRRLSVGAWMMSRALVRHITEDDNVHTMSYATYSAGVESLAVEQWVKYAAKSKHVKYVQVTLNGPLTKGSRCK